MSRTHWQKASHTACGWIAEGQKLTTEPSKVTCRTCRKAAHLDPAKPALRSAADVANHVRAKVAEKRAVSLTHEEAALLMAEFDRLGRSELGHE